MLLVQQIHRPFSAKLLGQCVGKIASGAAAYVDLLYQARPIFAGDHRRAHPFVFKPSEVDCDATVAVGLEVEKHRPFGV